MRLKVECDEADAMRTRLGCGVGKVVGAIRSRVGFTVGKVDAIRFPCKQRVWLSG